MRTGTQLVIVGLSLGLLTGICFLLLIGAAVGIGMGGGLKNPDAVMMGFKSAAGISLSFLILGVYLNFRQRSEAIGRDLNTDTLDNNNKKPNKAEMATPRKPSD